MKNEIFVEDKLLNNRSDLIGKICIESYKNIWSASSDQDSFFDSFEKNSDGSISLF